PKKDDLRRFIHGLITQEFDGPEPPPAVLDGLVAYVRSLSPNGCKERGGTAVRLEPMLHNVDTAVRLAQDSYSTGDRASARLLIAAARSTLGAIDERFELPDAEASRAVLREADADLRSIELADTPSPSMFRDWQDKWPARTQQLRAAEGHSLY